MEQQTIIAIISIVFAGGGIVGILKLVSDNWKALVSDLETRVDKQTGRIDEQEERYDRLRDKFDEQQNKLETQVSRVALLETREKLLTRRVVELEETEKEQAGHILQLRRQIGELRSGVNRLIKQIKDAGLEPVWVPGIDPDNGHG